MGDSALWGVAWVIMVLATTLLISAVFITLMTSLDLPKIPKGSFVCVILCKKKKIFIVQRQNLL